jgi:hypothetical protein
LLREYQVPQEIYEALVVDIAGRINNDVYQRATRLAFELVQDIQKLYAREFTAGSGASGAIGGVLAETRRTANLIEMTFGFSQAAHYLAYLEFGERGTESTPPGGARYTRKKAPPIRNIYEWIQRAKISTPRHFVDRAERNAEIKSQKKKPKNYDPSAPWWSIDPGILFAHAIAQARKRRGRAGMHLLEKYFRQEQTRIREALGAA